MYGEADHLIVLLLANSRAEEIYNSPVAAPWSAAGPMAVRGVFQFEGFAGWRKRFLSNGVLLLFGP